MNNSYYATKGASIMTEFPQSKKRKRTALKWIIAVFVMCVLSAGTWYFHSFGAFDEIIQRVSKAISTFKPSTSASASPSTTEGYIPPFSEKETVPLPLPNSSSKTKKIKTPLKPVIKHPKKDTVPIDIESGAETTNNISNDEYETDSSESIGDDHDDDYEQVSA